MNIVFALIPILIFLTILYYLDSFKLVTKTLLFYCLIGGIISATVSFLINTVLMNKLHIDYEQFSCYISPFIEELLKATPIIVLIQKKRVGFIIDAAIYGFAAGTGFALSENIYFLYANKDPNLLIWIIRGLGTATMHGGCTALFSVIIIGAKSRDASLLINFPIAFIFIYFIHSLFNHFYITPVIQTLIIIITLPILFGTIFKHTEKQLQDWLEIELSKEIELLNMINKGQFGTTRAGKYLISLKSKFSKESILDMYCFISIYLELSIKAKRNIMLKENDFPPIIENDIGDKLNELKQLRKQIGKTGEFTLSPLIRMNYRDLWKLKTLE